MSAISKFPADSNTQAMTESDKVYARLHEAIVRGELLPRQRLIELELAEQLQSGRAAVRTAIDRLAHDGLVVHLPNRGAHVRHIPVEEAIEMVEARSVLEGLAARHAALRATRNDISELQAIIAQMRVSLVEEDLVAYSKGNAELHDAVVRMAGHRTTSRLLRKLQANHVRFQYRMVLLPGRAELSLDEHIAIVDAIASHDPDKAETTMRRHLNMSVQELQRRMHDFADHS